MACRVFRSTKFGIIKDSTISSSALSAVIDRANLSIPLRFRRSETTSAGGTGFGAGERGEQSAVEITKTVDRVHFTDSGDLQLQAPEYKV